MCYRLGFFIKCNRFLEVTLFPVRVCEVWFNVNVVRIDPKHALPSLNRVVDSVGREIDSDRKATDNWRNRIEPLCLLNPLHSLRQIALRGLEQSHKQMCRCRIGIYFQSASQLRFFAGKIAELRRALEIDPNSA